MTSYSDLGKLVTNEIIMPIREKTIIRELLKVNTKYKEMSKDSIESWKFSDLSDPIVKRGLPDDSIFRDGIRSAANTVLMSSVIEGFKIERQEYDNYINEGIMIDTDVAIIAAEKVAEGENTLGLVGQSLDGTVYTIEGMKNLTGKSTESTAADFGTYGNALTKVALAKSTLKAAGVSASAYNLTLNQTQYAELEASLSTTGASEWDQVMRALNGGSGTMGQIRESSDVTAATGFLTPVDPSGKYFQMYETYPPTVGFGEDSKLPEGTSPIYGTLFSRVGFDWKYPEAVCYLTAI